VIDGLVSVAHPDAAAPYATVYTLVPAFFAAVAAVIA
jgi:hypothetical protein